MSSYVCQKCGKKIIGTVHLNQQGAFHIMCAIPPSQPDNTLKKPENINTSAEHVKAVDVSDTKLAGAVEEILDNLYRAWDAWATEDIEDGDYEKWQWAKNKRAKQAILDLISTARSDWAREVEGRMLKPVKPPEDHPHHDAYINWYKGYISALDEVRAIVRESK